MMRNIGQPFEPKLEAVRELDLELTNFSAGVRHQDPAGQRNGSTDIDELAHGAAIAEWLNKQALPAGSTSCDRRRSQDARRYPPALPQGAAEPDRRRGGQGPDQLAGAGGNERSPRLTTRPAGSPAAQERSFHARPLPARDRMVEVQIARRGVRDPHVLEAMRAGAARGVRRARLRGVRLRGRRRCRSSEGQTISQPYIVALMIEAAEVDARRPRARDRRRLGLRRGGDRAGSPAGSTRSSAIAALARAGARALRAARLRQRRDARRRRHAGLARGGAVRRDPRRGRRPAVPAGAEASSSPIGGRLVMPVGETQTAAAPAQAHAHRRETDYEEEDLGGVRFVPLIGEQGWAGGRPPLGQQPRARPVARADACRS